MAYTMQLTQTVTTPGGDSVSKTVSQSASGYVGLSEAIADETTDGAVNFALDVTACKAIYIVSDQDITLETNDGTTPDDTLALTADVPYVWHADDADSFAFGTDITALYVTNASGATANLRIECVYDATP